MLDRAGIGPAEAWSTWVEAVHRSRVPSLNGDIPTLRCSTSLALVYEQLIGAQVPPLKRCNGFGDVRTWRPSRRYAVRHDRALFHCRSTDQDRDAYLRTLDEAIGTERAVVIIATFARRMARSGARASSCRSAPLILRPP
jgi:hypothetical protein